jgi:OOP family OmpA-OmpF porin
MAHTTRRYPARRKPLAAAALAGLLGACATAENVDRLAARQPAGDAFARALATGYHGFAARERDAMYDWRDATRFADKGLRAARGDSVVPEALEDWPLDPAARGELASARAGLVAALASGGRAHQPETAARAQTQFDCWVEQQAEGHQAADIAACRGGFERALAQLQAGARDRAATRTREPAHRQLARAGTGDAAVTATLLTAVAPAALTVYFGFDRRAVSEAEQAALQQAVARAAAHPRARLSVTGHADTVGAHGYNLALSRDRARAVRAALMARGVPASQIVVRAKGETAPAIDTGDEVREPRNRRVVIALE